MSHLGVRHLPWNSTWTNSGANGWELVAVAGPPTDLAYTSNVENTLIPAVALMSFVVIPREEQYLETRFPSDYLAYKASVRRWL